MTASEYTISKINELVAKFPKTKVRYDNDASSNTHFVEVIPNEIYNLNLDYKNWEADVIFDFIDKYSDEGICFITDDSAVSIEKVDYEKTGSMFYYIETDDEIYIDNIRKILMRNDVVSIDNIIIKNQYSYSQNSHIDPYNIAA